MEHIFRSIEEVSDYLYDVRHLYKTNTNAVRYLRLNEKGKYVVIDPKDRETIERIKSENKAKVLKAITFLGDYTTHKGHSSELDLLKDMAYKHLNIFAGLPKEYLYR